MRRPGIWPAARTSRMKYWPRQVEHAAEAAGVHAVLPCAPPRWRRMAAELTPDPESPQAWRRRIGWLERLHAVGEYEQARRLGEKWALRCPSVAARAAQRRPRACRDRRRELPAACSPRRSRDLAGHDPARAAEVGSDLSTHTGILLGRLHEGAPMRRQPSRRPARPGTRSSCAKRWLPTGTSPQWQARPMQATDCARRCGFPGLPTRQIRTRPQRPNWPCGICGAVSSTRRGTC